MILLTVITIVMALGLGPQSPGTLKWAHWLGIFGSVLTAVTFAPQIWTTFKLKSAGALSMLMLVVQVFGSILFLYFNAYINKEDYTTWLPNLVTMIVMAFLLGMCVKYEFVDPWLGKKDGQEMVINAEKGDLYGRIPNYDPHAEASGYDSGRFRSHSEDIQTNLEDDDELTKHFGYGKLEDQTKSGKL
eukprot:TRINITY_DN3963_c0_g1_i16.p1 TRINITY_DN3963_c0_g1~~TRINITY_DN3963_c0_g1_i16.p1  ORF type:complete len:188 (-),score=52.57 TRINITY_DN3963_c0_g1_i16:19-582(-)